MLLVEQILNELQLELIVVHHRHGSASFCLSPQIVGGAVLDGLGQVGGLMPGLPSRSAMVRATRRMWS